MDDLDTAAAAGVAPWTDLVLELSDYHVAVFRDKYAVTPGHLLFVPRYKTHNVVLDCVDSAMRHGYAMVDRGECDAFNVGVNWGIAAGQTVMYPHIHLIPRTTGDCADPTGGVRNVIPGRGNYKKKYDTTSSA